METSQLIKHITYKASKEDTKTRAEIHILLLKLQLSKPEEMTKYIKEIRDLIKEL